MITDRRGFFAALLGAVVAPQLPAHLPSGRITNRYRSPDTTSYCSATNMTNIRYWAFDIEFPNRVTVRYPLAPR